VFALVAMAGIVWGYLYLPETRGKKLEDIEAHWKKGGHPKDL